MSRIYSFFRCPVCGKDVTNAGAGRVAHWRKHVREGRATEHLSYRSTYDFKPVKHPKGSP